MFCFLRTHPFLCENASKEYLPWYEPIPLPPTPPNGSVVTNTKTKGKKEASFNQHVNPSMPLASLGSKGQVGGEGGGGGLSYEGLRGNL